MAELSLTQLNKLVKSNPEITQSDAAAKLNVPLGKLSMLVFCSAKVAAQPSLKAPKTAASVKKLRDNEGNRWELIAARTGLSVAAVKAAYEEAGGDAKSSYTGKGRNFTGTATKRTGAKSGAARSGSKTKSASKKTSAARGRGGSKTKSASKKTAGVRRNLTGRRSTANPS